MGVNNKKKGKDDNKGAAKPLDTDKEDVVPESSPLKKSEAAPLLVEVPVTEDTNADPLAKYELHVIVTILVISFFTRYFHLSDPSGMYNGNVFFE